MDLKRYDLIAIIFFSVVLTLAGAQSVLSFTGTMDVISPGALEITSINASYYYKNDVSINERLEGDWGSINLETTGTLNTGQGANELFDMDQNVETTSDVTFNGVSTSWIDLDGNNRTTWPTETPFDQNLNTTDDVTFSTVDTGHGKIELYGMDQNVTTTDGVTFDTVDTGEGANELFDMDQNVLTTSDPTFATINTGEGAHELFDMDQDVLTGSSVTFDTVDTGFGANELYDMDQHVLQASDVTFSTVDTGHGKIELYGMDQNVTTTDGVTFDTVDTGEGANELFDMDQNVETTSDVTFNGVSTSWIDLDGNNRTTWPAGGTSMGGISTADYVITYNGTYYAWNATGALENSNADAATCLQAVIDINTNPKIIYLPWTYDADGSVITITYSGITIKTDGQTYLSGNTWTTPRITAVNITCSTQAVLNTRLEGINIRGINCDTLGGSYAIAQVFLQRSQLRPSESTPSGQGVRLLGSGYTLFVRLTDVKINDFMDTTASNSLGAISIESTHDGNGQIYITRCDYKVRDDNTVFIGGSGRSILLTVDRLSYVNLQSANTGSKVVQVWANGRFTDMKITNSLFELHYSQDIFQIDDSDADQLIFNCFFNGNTISLTNNEDVTFIDDNSAEGDWANWAFSGVYGSYNTVKVNVEHFLLGDTGNARFNVTMSWWMWGPD